MINKCLLNKCLAVDIIVTKVAEGLVIGRGWGSIFLGTELWGICPSVRLPDWTMAQGARLRRVHLGAPEWPGQDRVFIYK